MTCRLQYARRKIYMNIFSLWAHLAIYDFDITCKPLACLLQICPFFTPSQIVQSSCDWSIIFYITCFTFNFTFFVSELRIYCCSGINYVCTYYVMVWCKILLLWGSMTQLSFWPRLAKCISISIEYLFAELGVPNTGKKRRRKNLFVDFALSFFPANTYSVW